VLQLKRNPLHYAIATVTSATTFNQKKKVAKVLFLPFLCLLLHFFGVAFDTNPCSDRPLLRPCISSGTDGAASSTTVTLLPVCVLLPDGSHLGKCSSCWGGASVVPGAPPRAGATADALPYLSPVLAAAGCFRSSSGRWPTTVCRCSRALDDTSFPFTWVRRRSKPRDLLMGVGFEAQRKPCPIAVGADNTCVY
jgi:hypothetical protein